MARFLLLFCGVLGSLFAIEMLKPVQEAVIQPFTGLLAALSTAQLPYVDFGLTSRDLLDLNSICAAEMRVAFLAS